MSNFNKIIKVNNDQFIDKIFAAIKKDNSLCVDIWKSPECKINDPDHCGIICFDLFDTLSRRELPEYISFGYHNRIENLSRVVKVQGDDTIKKFLFKCWCEFMGEFDMEFGCTYIRMK